MALAKDLSSLPKAESAKTDGWAPDAEPRFIQVLVDQWAARNEAAGPKARATETARFRHSDAGKCARAIAFAALDLPPSDPMDLSGVWNTSLGTLIHDEWQAALQARYPDAEIETKVESVDGAGAGHIDAVIRLDGKTIVYELKTIGGFAFKMAVGERGAAQGPKPEHVMQAALGGQAEDADEVIIGYLSKEALSVAIAKRKGFDQLGRFTAEWTIGRDDYEPVARAEELRIASILRLLDDGTLPARKFPGTELPVGAEIVDPNNGRWEVQRDGAIVDTGTWWACGYCSHQTRCIATPSGRCSTEVLVEIGGAA